MKIIIIPNEPNPNMTGRHYFTAKALAAAGHEVHEIMWDLPNLMTPKQLLRHLFTSLRRRNYTYEDLHMHHFGRLPLFWPYLNGWLFKRQLKKLHASLGADMIFAESFTNETQVPKDLPFIYDLADDYAAPGDIYGSPVYKFAFRVLGVRRTMRTQCQRALAVTAVSDVLCRYAAQYNDTVIPLPNGVDADVIKNVAKTATQTVNPHSIIYVTGFGPWSRPVETMQAVTKLRKKFPDIHLTMVGEGSEAHRISDYIEQHQAQDYITYTGFVSDRRQLFGLIQQSAIGLNISEKNAWRDAAHPIKVLEYSALGKKVVSTDLEGVKALNYPNVFMFSDVRKKDSFAAVLERALRAPAESFDTVSKKTLQQYNWKSIISKLTARITDAKSTAMAQRIVHVTPSYPPVLGGLEKVVQNLALTQHQHGKHVSVITAGTEESKDEMPFPVRRLRSFVFASTKIMPGLLPALMRLNKKTTVHLHITQAYTPEMVWLAAKLKSLPYVAHIHLDVPRSTAFGIVLDVYKRLVLKRVLRAAAYVVVFTKDQQTAVCEKYGLDRSRVKIIPNGVEAAFYTDRLQRMHKKPRLLFVGRMGYQKNVPLLLHALEGISEQFETTLVGDGEDLAQLQQLAADLHLKNITFAGRADGTALRAYYKNADIFVLPSEREGMPLVLLEAMAMAMPIVATDVTGTRDVVSHAKNGYLVPLDDADAFRNALLKVAADDLMFQKLSQSSRAMADKYSWPIISEQFEAMYEEAAVKKTAHNISLWKLVVPLLGLANIAYFAPTLVSALITLPFFLLVPGYLLLNQFKYGIASRWETVSFSLGLSVLLLMVSGLALNALHGIGVEKPLSTLNIFMMLNALTIGLLWRIRTMPVGLRGYRLLPRLEEGLFIGGLTLLPLLAAGGAIRLNNGGSNVLTMALFAAVPLVFSLLLWRKKQQHLYPYALFMMGLSVLLATSMRGWYIAGHDIRHEFSVFQQAMEHGFWAVTTTSSDPYNACLSITILPTLLAKVSSLSGIYLYKIIFQIIFAAVLLPLYYLFKRIGGAKVALMSGFIILSFPTFLNDMPFLLRQEIAFLFFGLLAAVTFMKIARTPKLWLTVLLLAGLILSHYSTSYATLGLLFFAWAFYKVFTRKKPSLASALAYPILSLPLIITAFLFTFMWNAQVTATTSNLSGTLSGTIKDLLSGSTQRAEFVKYSLAPTDMKSPQEEFRETVGSYAPEATYNPIPKIGITALGDQVSKVANVETINSRLHTVSAQIFQVLLLLGALLFFLRSRKAMTKEKLYFFALTFGGIAMLILLTIMPRLSIDYSVIRLFQQTLFVAALPAVLAAQFLCGIFKRYGRYVVVGLLSFLFLNLSGFIPQALGGAPAQLSLNNGGAYYEFFYIHESDRKAVDWLTTYRNETVPVFMDTSTGIPPLDYLVQLGLVDKPGVLRNEEGYLYRNYINVTEDRYRIFLNSEMSSYNDPAPAADRPMLYTNASSEIYGKR